jgi:hypothetical protein
MTARPTPIVLVFALLALIALSPAVHAKEKLTMKDGATACKKWCDQNNRTNPARAQCYANCDPISMTTGRPKKWPVALARTIYCAVTSGSWGGRRLSPGGYVTVTGPTPGRPLPAGAHVAYPLDYPSRKEFLEDYRRRTAWVRALYDRVVPK